jgi:hypothetical protein
VQCCVLCDGVGIKGVGGKELQQKEPPGRPAEQAGRGFVRSRPYIGIR